MTTSAQGVGQKGTAAQPVYFSSFDVTDQVFYSTAHAHALVNLKPLVPGHVLVIPSRRQGVARLSDLSQEEAAAVFAAAHTVAGVIERAFGAEGLTISVQDGQVAGQSVPHLHFHILPRRTRDFEPNDAIYPLLERFGVNLSKDQQTYAPGSNGEQPTSTGPDNEDRQPRSQAEMRREAEWLASLFPQSTD